MVDQLGRSTREYFGVMEKIPDLIMVGVAWVYKSAQTDRNVHLNWAHCIAYKLHCNDID